MSKIAIKVENLKKEFKVGNENIPVIKNLNFEIEDGDFVSIMGPSGCGKSTLLYMLGALDKPTSGDIYIYGKNYKDMSNKDLTLMKRRDVGFIFQFYNLVPNLSVEDNILLPLLVDKKNIKKYEKKYKEILELTEISNKVKMIPRELSGGQQQRVAIARALMIEPKILFADEPIGNLDVKTGQKIMKLFVEINKDLKTTVVQVTHSPESSEYGKSLIRLLDGNIIEKKSLIIK
ncbi:MAG: ABC transporter ATP-binding protein [Clostridium sp.]|uniref:ABC transporter ATP-binding protein n=1 Tax=Clostridium sp. DSM 8431 TaxID=1761781 RepID=UPI0008E339D6|nr:ABC transporter ATP-binding protein [Clostridium sp. DSM 8431]MCR4943767.1 ABC transporter ATP-binding protein [Clostridium sp.]SFU74458.1 putative ABC transport system ATP-binding protein [Clostridium sp. DSM 8431]